MAARSIAAVGGSARFDRPRSRQDGVGGYRRARPDRTARDGRGVDLVLSRAVLGCAVLGRAVLGHAVLSRAVLSQAVLSHAAQVFSGGVVVVRVAVGSASSWVCVVVGLRRCGSAPLRVVIMSAPAPVVASAVSTVCRRLCSVKQCRSTGIFWSYLPFAGGLDRSSPGLLRSVRGASYDLNIEKTFDQTR